MKTTAEYAIDLVATGAESCAEDDMNESEEIEDGLHHDACDLAIEMARQIRDHADVVLGWVDEQAVTRKPSDLWQAVLATWYGSVADVDDLLHAHAPAASIWIVRRSATPVDGKMPKHFDRADVAFQREGYGGDSDIRERLAQAEAMARGLNAAVAS